MTDSEIARLRVGQRGVDASGTWTVAYPPQKCWTAAGSCTSVLVRRGRQLKRIDPYTPGGAVGCGGGRALLTGFAQ